MGGARKLMRRYFLPLFDLGGDFAALGPVGRCEEALFLSFTITFVLLTAPLSNHALLAAVRSAGSNKSPFLPGLLRKFNLRSCGCGEAAFFCGGGLDGGGELGGGGASFSLASSLGLWSWRSVSASSSSALDV